MRCVAAFYGFLRRECHKFDFGGPHSVAKTTKIFMDVLMLGVSCLGICQRQSTSISPKLSIYALDSQAPSLNYAAGQIFSRKSTANRRICIWIWLRLQRVGGHWINNKPSSSCPAPPIAAAPCRPRVVGYLSSTCPGACLTLSAHRFLMDIAIYMHIYVYIYSWRSPRNHFLFRLC